MDENNPLVGASDSALGVSESIDPKQRRRALMSAQEKALINQRCGQNVFV
jgi:hypothetical protein